MNGGADEVTREQWKVFWSFIGIVAVTAAVFCALVFWFPSCAKAASAVTISWDANTEPDLTGYRIYRAPDPGGPWELAKELGLVTEGVVDQLADGRYCFALTALDSFGNESERSVPVCATVDSTAPATPINVVIRVTVHVKVEVVP